nr:unnamed protein product [Callosobruchus analis]
MKSLFWRKGAITPKQMPTEDITANLELAIRFLPEDKAREIRKPPKSNLKPKELKELRDINNDTSITALPADKDNATVVMDTKDYRNKIKELLDPGTHHTLRKNPTKTMLRKTRIQLSTKKPRRKYAEVKH